MIEKRTFAAELDSLSSIREFVRSLGEPALDARCLYKLVLAVDELATNVIGHGYKERRITGSVDVLVDVRPGEIRVVLEDDAPPFDGANAPGPDEAILNAPLEERHPGGLGLMLIRDGVDVFHYERDLGRNRNTLIKRFACQASSGDGAFPRSPDKA